MLLPTNQKQPLAAIDQVMVKQDFGAAGDEAAGASVVWLRSDHLTDSFSTISSTTVVVSRLTTVEDDVLSKRTM